jgi:hypothetical protein
MLSERKCLESTGDGRLYDHLELIFGMSGTELPGVRMHRESHFRGVSVLSGTVWQKTIFDM